MKNYTAGITPRTAKKFSSIVENVVKTVKNLALFPPLGTCHGGKRVENVEEMPFFHESMAKLRVYLPQAASPPRFGETAGEIVICNF